ncbi:response regulator [Botrimarina hoheduenensis]|uniref:Hydrogenase transcriptional regulatory protein hupR1 n=1 Tax=Botrimarina hoheduenensis TaxID=2528000 RepID=A0A5C5VWA3_9BACT|nr:response regulator [Botrimarina hoheduenensis]TWT42898.1 Hydrogenase transcriptional regulatory protein hupR1 [Botrimarina hoheduenensis]
MPVPDVLLIDDDPNLLRALCRAMHGEHFRLITARSAEEALTVVKSHPVGVIVCDERMPGRSGTEFCSWVADHCPEITRIVMTGHPSDEVESRAIDHGRVFRFFSKPCRAEDLAWAIREGLLMYAEARAGKSDMAGV